MRSKETWSHCKKTLASSFLGVVSAAAALVAGTNSAQAGTATFDFSTDPANTPGLTIVGNNDIPYQAAGGNPGGFLAITYSVNSQYTGVVFPDIDQGRVVTAFKFECDLRVGNPNGNAGRPADGFSISFARGNDPLLESVPDSVSNTGNFAGGIPEGGATTGIAISFDTWSGNALPDGPDIEGIIVRVDNRTILRQALPTRNGVCADDTSLQTGPYNQAYFDNGGEPTDPGSWAELCWQPFSVEMDSTGKLTVKYKNRTLLDKAQTTYFPSVGRLILAGRTGGANENTHVDNIRLTTEAISDAQPPTVPSNLTASIVHPRRIKLSWAAATDDSGRVAYEVERDGTLLPGLVSGTSFADTVSPNTSYSYKIRAIDPALNRSVFTAATTIKTPVEQPVFTPGVVKFEAYRDLTGTAIDGLTSSDKFVAGTPDEVRVLGAIDTPNGYGDNYGAKVSGFIVPAETASYRFFIRSDDASQLFLSTDDKEANAQMIAEETGCCDPFKDPDDSLAPSFETSTPVSLTAGKRYAFYALVKEGGGGDYLQVAWRKEGDTAAPATLSPLTGPVIGAVVDPNQGVPILTQQPKSVSVDAGGSATFTTAALGTQPLTYQWQRNGVNIPGATSASYTVSNASGSNFGSYTVVVTNEEGSTTSSAATLSVTGLPTVLFIHASGGPNDSDRAVANRLLSQGWQVVSMGAAASQTSDANGKALIVISSTVASGEVGDKFRNTTVPVFSWEAALQDNFLMTEDQDGVTRGITGNQTQLNIVTATHPAAAGFAAGNKTTMGTAQEVSWGVPAPAAVIIAAIVDDSTHAAIYAFDAGATLIDGTSKAAGKRLHFGMGDNTFVGLNPDGLKLFDAGVKWLAGSPGPTLSDVTKPGDPIVSTSTDAADSPNAERVPNAIDDKTNTKYLNFKELNTGFTVTPSAGATIVQGITLTSANDQPPRDPASYRLEGSNDGTTFTLISEGTVPAFTNRFTKVEIMFSNSTAYTSYRLIFPTVVNATSANSMQIAEVELLGTVTGGGSSGSKVSIGKAADKVSITYTGTLQSADSVRGPYSDVAGATSPYSVTPSGGAKFYRSR